MNPQSNEPTLISLKEHLIVSALLKKSHELDMAVMMHPREAMIAAMGGDRNFATLERIDLADHCMKRDGQEQERGQHSKEKIKVIMGITDGNIYTGEDEDDEEGNPHNEMDEEKQEEANKPPMEHNPKEEAQEKMVEGGMGIPMSMGAEEKYVDPNDKSEEDDEEEKKRKQLQQSQSE